MSSLFISDRKANPKLLEKNKYSSSYKPIQLLGAKPSTKHETETKNEVSSNQDDHKEDYGGLPPPSQDISHIIRSFRESQSHKKDSFTIEDIACASEAKSKAMEEVGHFVTRNLESKQTDLSKFSASDRKLNKLRKVERSKTAGNSWFNLPATEVTEAVKNDLEILKMRSALDPKHFYKRSESKALPKYFQVGKVMESPLDFYQDRDIKKIKSKSLVEELLQDAEFQKFNKRKYQEAVKSKNASGYNKAHAKMKKMKKK